MHFQLLKLIIWPINEEFAPREVNFLPGKLNIITGASRTGKSAIIPIIDYCLASGECTIPIDTIRNFASWYGIIFETESEQILICRKVPTGNKVSNDFYLQRANKISIPQKIDLVNETTEGIKHLLNTVSGVPYVGLDSGESTNNYTARLSFRDLMALNFQTQDIVANQNILFYKTHKHEHREKLRNWFPYILGAENLETLSARQKIQILERRLSQLKKEYERAKSVSYSWRGNLEGQLRIAQEYGLLDNSALENVGQDDLVLLAKEILSSIPEYTMTEPIDLQLANQEERKLEEEEIELSTQIGQIKRRLSDIKKLKSGMNDYSSSVRRRLDRLQISKWLEDITVLSGACPSCGSAEHPNSNVEMAKIISAFEIAEEEAKSYSEIPTSFSREEQRLEEELGLLFERKKDFQSRFEFLLNSNKKVKDDFHRRKNMFLFLGHMKASLETFERLSGGGEFLEEILQLENELQFLKSIANYKNVQERLNAALARISQLMLNYLQGLDVEKKYREVAPKFDVKDLNISVLSNDSHWHFLSQVGSASNWVSFHISLMCALQEYFTSNRNSCVPSFVIFDQPSQVYFPKLKRNIEDDSSIDHKYEDEDVDAVKGIFETISSSITKTGGKWQGLILDHADDTIYSELENIHEVEVWRNGEKLIPTYWYQE